MDTIPPVVPALPRQVDWNRHLNYAMPFKWLAQGWADLKIKPLVSLIYGVILFSASVLIVWALFTLNIEHFLFPAIAGFMVAGPAFAVGLYEKSRALFQGRAVNLKTCRPHWSHSGGQIMFIGVILVMLLMMWVRAAVLLYALMFGHFSFFSLELLLPALLTTPSGVFLLVVGGLIGGLFAAFSFAISVFSIPMLLEKDTDAFTAMGTSMALVWNNLPVMLVWGGLILGFFALSCLTGFVGLIVIFPLLGHATWHAYKAVEA